MTNQIALIILLRMIFSKVCTKRGLVAIGFTVMALIAFNLSHPTLKNDLLTSFNEWYQGISPKLTSATDPQQADLSLRVSVTLSDPSIGGAPAVWTLPTRSLLESTDRDNTARVLQLIRESGIFGLSPMPSSAKKGPSVAVSVRDEQRQFEITIPLDQAQKNIQLQNLMKLMDLYSHAPSTSTVEPARL